MTLIIINLNQKQTGLRAWNFEHNRSQHKMNGPTISLEQSTILDSHNMETSLTWETCGTCSENTKINVIKYTKTQII